MIWGIRCVVNWSKKIKMVKRVKMRQMTRLISFDHNFSQNSAIKILHYFDKPLSGGQISPMPQNK